MSAQSIRRLSSLTSGSSDPLLTQQRSKLDNENDDEKEHDLGSKSRERQSWFAPFSRARYRAGTRYRFWDVSTKHPSLAFVHVREKRPAFDPATSKLDNENDDEHEHDLGSKAMNDNLGLPLF